MNNCYILFLGIVKKKRACYEETSAYRSMLVAMAVLIVGVWSLAHDLGYHNGYTVGVKEAYNPIDVGANTITFSAEELQKFESIKSRLTIYNADPAFTGERDLQWISMRNSSSASWNPAQKSMEYLCFWSGQGASGEWEVVVSIYNKPGLTSDFVVEVSRFTWHEIQVKLDGQVVAVFPQVTENTVSVGYTTFSVKAE